MEFTITVHSIKLEWSIFAILPVEGFPVSKGLNMHAGADYYKQ